jgi:CDGSH-type Zn-finger protein
VIRRDGREQVVERPRIALCRCGHSESKPYCDATHSRVGFLAPPAEIEISPL